MYVEALVYTSGPPLTYSVRARARRPSIAKRPFHISADDENIGCDLLSADIPFNSGTTDAAVNNPAVIRNHDTPPLFTCDNKSFPLANSTAIADTKPNIAALPLMISGAGPENANRSSNLVLLIFVEVEGGTPSVLADVSLGS